MRALALIVTALLAGLVFVSDPYAFSFKETQEKEAQEAAAQQDQMEDQIRQLMSVPCREGLKNKKIALIIGEYHENEVYLARQSKYGLLFQEVDKRLRSIGLKTYTQEEIEKQIAEKEIAAFMANDMDAAASAAGRLKASFVLRGLIESKTRVNPAVGIKEVYVSMAFTMVDAKGRIISDVMMKGDAFSGEDTLAAAHKIVKEKADLLVAQLYHDYCTGASQ